MEDYNLTKITGFEEERLHPAWTYFSLSVGGRQFEALDLTNYWLWFKTGWDHAMLDYRRETAVGVSAVVSPFSFEEMIR